MLKETVIEIPIRCANCSYPEQFGAKVNAEIKCHSDDDVVRKVWKCPICNSAKTIEVSMDSFNNKKPLRFHIQSAGKKEEDMIPGQVSKMVD